MDAPTISVVMPMFNDERYVAQAVDSVLGQTFNDFEFIVIDDGSTDGSLKIAQQYASRDSRIRVLARPTHTGIVGALNDGIAAASGEWIARMDADDISLPERFARQRAFLAEHSECVALGSGVLFVDPERAPIDVLKNRLDHEGIEAEYLGGKGMALVHPTAMIRRSAIVEAGGYRQECQGAEDLDLFLRLGEHGRLANVPDVLLEVRRHADSVTAIGKIQENIRLKTAIIREAFERRGLDCREIRLRSMAQPQSLAELHAGWACQAVQGGYWPTARKHALKAMAHNPFILAAWRAMAYSFLGRKIGYTMGRVRRLLHGRRTGTPGRRRCG